MCCHVLCVLRLLHSHFHAGWRTGECHGVPACAQQTDGHQPWPWHHLDRSLHGHSGELNQPIREPKGAVHQPSPWSEIYILTFSLGWTPPLSPVVQWSHHHQHLHLSVCVHSPMILWVPLPSLWQLPNTKEVKSEEGADKSSVEHDGSRCVGFQTIDMIEVKH